jgi:hypothetical protein
MISQDEYPRKATQDVRGAMATTLANYISGLEFDPGDGSPQYRFAEVFDDWPSFLDRIVMPSACVLPNSWQYGAALLTPVLIEDTWFPQHEPGWGLWKTSEAEVDFELSLRTSNVSERHRLLLGIEAAFQDTRREANRIVLDMPSYYGLPVRYSLRAARLIDAEDPAMREQRDAILTISAQADAVALRPVFPLSITIKKVSLDVTPPTIS